MVSVMTKCRLASVRATWLEWLGDENDGGALPGIGATWHMGSQTLLLHPPRHRRVPGGGLTSTGQGVAVHHGLWRPSRVSLALCRGTLLAAVRRAWRQGQLQHPEPRRPQRGAKLRHKLGRQQWNVQSRERSPHGPRLTSC
jgi:Putative transposase